jgi:hypothetical protein
MAFIATAYYVLVVRLWRQNATHVRRNLFCSPLSFQLRPANRTAGRYYVVDLHVEIYLTTTSN